MWDPFAEFETEVLPNGLTVHAAHWPGRPWVAMGFLVHSGARLDPIGLEGTAHFVEHMVSRNVSVSYREIKVFFEELGGVVELGSTSQNNTYYRFFCPAEESILDKALSIFGEIVFSARLENYLETQRSVILEEYKRKYHLQVMTEIIRRRLVDLYAGTWLERFITPLGAPESIERISLGDLQNYYDTYYVPSNVSMVSVGGMQLGEIVKLLSKSPFIVNKQGERVPLLKPVDDFHAPLENRHYYEFSKLTGAEKIGETGSYNGIAVVPGRIGSHRLRILSEMLDEILFEEVRERRGWTYHIETGYQNLQAFHEFAVSCSNLKPQALDEIESVIDECIASVVHRPDLFERVKRGIVTQNRVLDINGRWLCRGAILDLCNNQRIVSCREDEEKIMSTTFEDICNDLACLSPERRSTLVIAP